MGGMVFMLAEDYPACIASGFILLMVAWFLLQVFPAITSTFLWIFVLPGIVVVALYYIQMDYGPSRGETKAIQDMLPPSMPMQVMSETDNTGITTPQEEHQEAPRDIKNVLNITDSIVLRSKLFGDEDGN